MTSKAAAPKPMPAIPSFGSGQPMVRRSPLQGRSQDKVQRILTATAELADAVPLESITMAQIAEAAGASFSSIYRFFPSKDAILEAVAMASLDRLQTRYEAYFTSTAPQDPGTIIDRAIDIYVDFVTTEPGFKSLWIDSLPTPDIASRHRRVHESAIQLAKIYAVQQLHFRESPELDLRLAIAATATTEILRFAFQQNDYPQDQVVDELKRWLRAALLMLA